MQVRDLDDGLLRRFGQKRARGREGLERGQGGVRVSRGHGAGRVGSDRHDEGIKASARSSQQDAPRSWAPWNEGVSRKTCRRADNFEMSPEAADKGSRGAPRRHSSLHAGDSRPLIIASTRQTILQH